MKNLILLFLTCAAVLGQSRPVSYDNVTRAVAQTNLTQGFDGITNHAATASQAATYNSAKKLVSTAITGTGNLVADTAPAIASPTIADPIITSTFFFEGLVMTFEGAVPNAFETFFQFTEPVADATYIWGGTSMTTPGTIELGHASANTLAGSGGFMTIEGKPVASPASATTGDIMRYDGTQWVRVAIGTAGQVLAVNAGATSPEWVTSGAGAGDVVGPSSATNNNLVRFDGTTGKLIQDGAANLDDSGNLTTAGAVSGTRFQGTGAVADSDVVLPDDDNSHTFSIQANNTTTTNVRLVAPAAPFAGLVKTSIGSVTNWIPDVAVEGTDYASPVSTNAFTNKGYDASATGNNLIFTDYKEFVAPFRVDGAGCTIVTNSYTDNTWGLATYAGNADTNGNYALFRVGKVPYDLNVTNALTLRGLGIRTDGTSTTSPSFTIAYYQPAASAASMPTDFTACSGFIISTSVTISSAAANDIFYFDDITLTGWAAALTTGRDLIIAIARGDNGNNDALSVTAGSLEFTRLK